MNTLSEKYSQEIIHILEKYPPDKKRSAVMPLLYLAQREKKLCHERFIRRDCRNSGHIGNRGGLHRRFLYVVL